MTLPSHTPSQTVQKAFSVSKGIFSSSLLLIYGWKHNLKKADLYTEHVNEVKFLKTYEKDTLSWKALPEIESFAEAILCLCSKGAPSELLTCGFGVGVF